MRLRVPPTLGLLSTVALAQLGGVGSPPTILTDGGMDELGRVAEGWDVLPSGDTVKLRREILTHPMECKVLEQKFAALLTA